MKKVLIEKLDSFNAAPFTIQRISELLSEPRKQYSRIDKFMRAVEKNILVVSTQEPGRHRSESENGDSLDSALNGGDFTSEVNVDMENDNFTKDFTVETHRPPFKSQNQEVATVVADAPSTTVKKPLIAISKEEAEISEKLLEDDVKNEKADITTIISISGSTSTVSSVNTSEESVLSVVESVTLADEPMEVPESTIIDSTQVDSCETAAASESEIEQQSTESLISSSSEILEETNGITTESPVVSDEPICPSDEVLVDTTEISGETPLAALENIVAITTDAAAEVSQQTVTPIIIESESIKTGIASVIDAAIDDADDDSAMSSKRIKITPDITNESEEVHDIPVEEKLEQVVPKPLEDETTKEPESIESLQVESVEINIIPAAEIVEEPKKISQEIPEDEEDSNSGSSEGDLLSAPLTKILEIPPPVSLSELATLEDLESIAKNENSIAAEMETISIPIGESTMALDEDESAAPTIPELEMTPIANKMDTGSPDQDQMDVDDEVPMDQ